MHTQTDISDGSENISNSQYHLAAGGGDADTAEFSNMMGSVGDVSEPENEHVEAGHEAARIGLGGRGNRALLSLDRGQNDVSSDRGAGGQREGGGPGEDYIRLSVVTGVMVFATGLILALFAGFLRPH